MELSSYLNLHRLWHISTFELKRLFASKRGLVALCAFSLVWLLILRFLISESVAVIASPDFAAFASGLLNTIGIEAVLNWPVAELSVYWLIALLCFPTLCILMCNDQTVGDRERGTIRFLVLRSSRLELLLGRFLGQMLVLTILIALTLSSTLILVALRDGSLVSQGLHMSDFISLNIILALCPYVALMSLFNTFARSPRLTVVSVIIFFIAGGFIVKMLVWQFPALNFLDYIFPGVQINQMKSLSVSTAVVAAITVGQTVIYLFLAERILARSSI